MKNFFKSVYSLNVKYIIGVALGVAFIMPTPLHAVKAKPGVIEFSQPDGSLLPVRLYGDEKTHFAATDDGVPVTFNSKGFYEYALQGADGKWNPSGIVAKPKSSRSNSENAFVASLNSASMLELRKSNPVLNHKYKVMNVSAYTRAAGETRYTYSTAAFPVFGDPHSIVVLVEFQNYKFSMDNPNDFYKRMLNQDGFSDFNGTGSVREYFIDNSMGQFRPTFDVFGPITLKNNRSYYGSNEEARGGEMVVEAVRALDDSVNFRNYDHNGDGYVDSIYIIYANVGEADGGPEESVWPYSWELVSEGYNLKADGVIFNAYGCSNELEFRTKKPTGIGTFTHEFSHVMGLPDLYNTVDYNDYSTPLSWSVLDEGPYNNGGHTPPNFSAFERYSLGWMDCNEIKKTGDYSLDNIAESNRGFIMTTEENKDEFYLLECRQQTGWDKYLPGHGMLVWHVDFLQRHWDDNTVNDNKSHQYVKLVRADDSTNMNTLPAASFPGSAKVTEFSWNTVPKLQSWKNTQLNVTSLADITELNGVVKFHATATEDRSGVDDILSDASDGRVVISNRVASVEGEGRYPVYDLTGRSLGTVSSSSPVALNPGICIINNRKYIVH